MIFSTVIFLCFHYIIAQQRNWSLVCHQPVNLGRPGVYLRDACCPAEDPTGIPYSTEIQECCCGQVFKKDQDKYCCMPDNGCDLGTAHIEKIGTECKRIVCPTPPDLNDPKLDFNCTGNASGDTCKFGCAEGYQVVDENKNIDIDVATCSDNFSWEVTIPPKLCCFPECDKLPENTKLDFMIVLDKSSSIGNANFDLIKKFLYAMIDILPMTADSGRMSVTTFNSDVEEVFDFADSLAETKDQLKMRVDDIVYSGRGTFANRALEVIADSHVRNNDMNRPEVKDILLVITDGVSRGSKEIESFSDDIKSIGVEIFCIGVGNDLDIEQIEGMASIPADHYTKIISVFSELEKVAREFLKDYCPIPTCTE